MNTSITSKFLERGGLALTPSGVAQITQIKETVSCLESKFASFKTNTDNRLADSVSNEMFQDKITAINQQHELDIRNLKSRVSDLELSDDTLLKKLKILEDQNKQQFRNIGRLEGQVLTLTSLLKDKFQTKVKFEMPPSEDEIIVNVPTSNRFGPLTEQSTRRYIETDQDKTVDQYSELKRNSNYQMQGIPLPPIYTENQAQCQSLYKSTPLNPTAVEYVSSTTPVSSLSSYVQSSAPTAPAVTQAITTLAPTRMAHSIPRPLLPRPPPPLQQPIVVPYVQPSALTTSEVIHPITTMASGLMVQSIPFPILSQPSPAQTQPIGSQHVSSSSITDDSTINSDILLIMDSNGNQIDPKLLYPIEGSTSRKLYCPLLEDIDKLIENCTFKKLPTIIVIHCGTNNLDRSDPKRVLSHLTETATYISKKFISSKIVISGILPRGDYHSRDIHAMNMELSKHFQLLTNVHFVAHHNLLKDNSNTLSLLSDKKHLNDVGIRAFSRNLKYCIFGRSGRPFKSRRLRPPGRSSPPRRFSPPRRSSSPGRVSPPRRPNPPRRLSPSRRSSSPRMRPGYEFPSARDSSHHNIQDDAYIPRYRPYISYR